MVGWAAGLSLLGCSVASLCGTAFFAAGARLGPGVAPRARLVTASASEHPIPAASAALHRRPTRPVPRVSRERLGQAGIDRVRSREAAMAHLARLRTVGEFELASGCRRSIRGG